MKRNIWLDGMMGLVTGDALGNPVQFMSRVEIKERGPVCGMEAGGVYNTPIGTWTDDSSMALATLDSIREIDGIVPEDIMLNFVRWLHHGDFTPFGKAFDEGRTCSDAIERFAQNRKWETCGKTGEKANGNGALMRILPVCLYLIEKKEDIHDAVEAVHQITSLTHNHRRAMLASGLYYFMAREIVLGSGSLTERLQKGLDEGFAYYGNDILNLTQLAYLGRLRDLAELGKFGEDEIRSSGYVIDTIEAAVWSLITTKSYKECLLKAVNLGCDADTVGAVAGGLAGLFYGYQEIPTDWLEVLQKREWIEELCIWDYKSPIPVTDIHAHMIPDIDDGSLDMNMTMEMIRCAYRQGVRGILCTPHGESVKGTDDLKEKWEEMSRRCGNIYPDLKLGLGCELYLYPGAAKDGIEGLRFGEYLPLNGTKYVLVEFSQSGLPFERIQEFVMELKEAGWIPVLAHAERYYKSYRGIEDVRWLKEQGCKIQINAYSLEGGNQNVKEQARQMVQEKLVDFLGTDAHRMPHRPPKVASGIKTLMEIADQEYVKQIAYQNAKDLLKM